MGKIIHEEEEEEEKEIKPQQKPTIRRYNKASLVMKEKTGFKLCGAQKKTNLLADA